MHLSVQLQKKEQAANAPSVRELAEFDRLKEHFEDFLKRSNPSTSSTSAVLRDAPLLSARALLAGSTSLSKGRLGREREASAATSKDELPLYTALHPASRLDDGSNSIDGLAGHQLNTLREMRDIDDVAEVEKRWTQGWQQSIDAR